MNIQKQRFDALDVLRGLSMIIMALDHSRDFFALGFVYYAPTDITLTNLEVFFTRWITHFAAPTFIFLAGIGLYFASERRTKAELAYLAFTRGLWLIFLELTLVGFFWSFSTDFIYSPKIAVLFTIGVCMLFMSFIIYLPKYFIALLALSMIFGHNLLDTLNPESFNEYAWVWHLFHNPDSIYLGGIEIRVVYPFIPWIGVMAAGYLIGPLTKLTRQIRKKVFFTLGLFLILFGFILRYTNIYGDLNEWSIYESFSITLMSFLNFTKYPASLIYLSVFLGFSMLILSLLDTQLNKYSIPLKNLGQAPFFFYILHIPLLHLGGVSLALFTFGEAHWLLSAPLGKSPQGYHYFSELAPTYIAWVLVIIILYYPVKYFATLKQRQKSWWMSYL